MYNGDTKEFEFEENNELDVNEIIEIRNGEEIESLEDELEEKVEEPKKESKKKNKVNPFKKLIEMWNNFSKKEKIIAVSIAVIILLIIIIGLVLIFKKPNNNEVKEPVVVLEADNYRYENGKLFFLNDNGEDIGSYDCKNKDETLCYVAYSNNEDNFDVTKNIYENETLVNRRMNIINDDFVFIYDNDTVDEGNVLLYSIKENSDYEKYALVKQYDLEDNYVIVKNDNDIYELLLFDENGFNQVLDTQYNYLGIITENKEENNYLVGVKNNKWYIIDYQDNEKTKAISYEVRNYNDSLIAVTNDMNEYILVDYKNKELTEESYDYINFVNEYVVLVKDKELFIADKELNKLHEEGIKLFLSDYNKVNIFDEKSGKLVDSRYAFGFSINNNTIEVTIKNGEAEEVKLVNTLESIVSSNYDNINYFDGKLYFYSDEEKTNLLGTYECTNLNDITSNDSTLSNCFIASNSEFSDNDMTYNKNSIGLLPIFNNRFVFIKDNPALTSADTMSIVLYDLAANKKLGTYRAIDAGNYNGKTGISFVEGTGIPLMAKNSKGYYGILNVNLSEVGSLANVKFNDKYKNIEAIGDNYIIQKPTDTYYMINKSGESLTSEFSGKIMGYKNNYVKVKSGNNYSVFSFDGKEVSNKTFSYVELYNSVFATIDSSDSLNLYKYNDEEQTPLCNTNIKLNITGNYKEGKSFNVAENNGVYTITVKGANGSSTTHTCPEVKNETSTEVIE